MPTLRALQCLVAVLERGSITDAAAHLHMSQPALSHQLAGLERELGGPVVERLPRGVRSTSLGRAVAGDAQASLAAAGRVVRTARAVTDGEAGHLRLACAESMTVPLVAPVLQTWRRRHQGVTISLAEMSSADALATAIEQGEADIAIGPRTTPSAAHESLIGREEIVVAVASDHPLAGAAAVSFADLATESVVGYHPDNGLGPWLDGVALEHGVRLSSFTRTKQAVTAAHLAASGLGVALVPTTAIGPAFTGVLRHLAPPLHRDVVATVATPSDPLVGSVLRLLEKRGVPVPAAVRARLES